MNRYPLPPDSETSRRVKRPRYAISILAILQIVTATLMILMMLDPEDGIDETNTQLDNSYIEGEWRTIVNLCSFFIITIGFLVFILAFLHPSKHGAVFNITVNIISTILSIAIVCISINSFMENYDKNYTFLQQFDHFLVQELLGVFMGVLSILVIILSSKYIIFQKREHPILNFGTADDLPPSYESLFFTSTTEEN